MDVASDWGQFIDSNNRFKRLTISLFPMFGTGSYKRGGCRVQGDFQLEYLLVLV